MWSRKQKIESLEERFRKYKFCGNLECPGSLWGYPGPTLSTKCGAEAHGLLGMHFCVLCVCLSTPPAIVNIRTRPARDWRTKLLLFLYFTIKCMYGNAADWMTQIKTERGHQHPGMLSLSHPRLCSSQGTLTRRGSSWFLWVALERKDTTLPLSYAWNTRKFQSLWVVPCWASIH